MGEAVEIFLSYSRKDERLLQDLKTHLEPLRLTGHVSLWHDGLITPGQEWDDEIKKNLDRSKIIALLVSKHFINSKYCQEVELKKAYERHEAGDACVIPIILRHCAWKGVPFGEKSLGKLQALPRNVRPITDWPNRDKAFTNVVEGIQSIIEVQRLSASEKSSSLLKANENNLSELWEDIISVLEPLGTRALMQQQGKLVKLTENVAQVAVESKPLLKMAQGRTENVERAFEQVLGYRVQVDIFHGTDLAKLWREVVLALKSQGTRALMQQQGTLLSFDGSTAWVGITSKPLLKMAEGRIPNVELAFKEVLGHEVKVHIQECSDFN